MASPPARSRAAASCSAPARSRRAPGTLRLTGRLANGQRLPRGRYRVSLQATDAAGNRSEAVFIRFTLC